jgi:hypothetical protein
MNFSIKTLVVTYATFAVLYLNSMPMNSTISSFEPTVRTVGSSSKTSSHTPTKVKPKVKGKLTGFLRQMGEIEGLGSYETVSRSGYLGMYQFHPTTLAHMGVNVTKEDFLTNPMLQDSVMVQYMRMNARGLNKLIKRYNGTYYNGVYITKAGILAGAHLVGVGGVLTFFHPEKYNYKTVDGNGVHVSTYIEKFSGYDLRGL